MDCRPLVLVDMDGVLADFELAVYTRFHRDFPDRSPISLDKRTVFYADLHYEDVYPGSGAVVKDYVQEKDFFRSLEPIAGAIDGMENLSKDFEVYICTSPLSYFYHCVSEKFLWVEQHLGYEWTKRIVLTRDKTIIHGDILIDDRPDIDGYRKPSWVQLVFDQPYNRNLPDKPRMLGWNDIDAVHRAIALK